MAGRKSTRGPVKTAAPKREAHTAAARPSAPPAAQPAAAPTPIIVQQPSMGGGGMLQQIASVAVGSAIGHTVGRAITGTASSLFGGGEETQPQQQNTMSSAPSNQSTAFGCETDSKAFIDCMSKNNNDLSTCQFYMDMLKACQENKRFA